MTSIMVTLFFMLVKYLFNVDDVTHTNLVLPPSLGWLDLGVKANRDKKRKT